MEESIKFFKKKTTEDWQKAFPELTALSYNKFYKIAGSLILGIETINIPNIIGYKPHFVMYPLWKDTLKECLDAPIAYFSINNRKGFEFSIPYVKHDIFFAEAVECALKQIPLSFNGDVSLKEVFQAFDLYSNRPPLSMSSNSYLQARLSEAKFYATLYTGNTIQIQNLLHEIEKRNWDLKNFATGKIDYGNWLKKLQERADRPNEFFSLIESNSQDKKLSKLQRSELKV